MRLTRLMPEADEDDFRPWIRRFLHEHLRRWSDAYALGWSDSAIDGHILGLDLVERDWRRLVEAGRQFETNFVAVAREGQQPLGAVWAEVAHHPYLLLEIGVISWIYVDPSARGQAVGDALVGAALDWMRARRLPLVELSVIADNERAVRLYERAGLRVVDHRMGRPL